MKEPRAPSLRDLVDAERGAAPDVDAEARVWAGVERRLAHGPPPPPLSEGSGLAGVLKWIGGLALVGAVVAGAALWPREAPAPPVAPPNPPPIAALAPADPPVPADMSLVPAPTAPRTPVPTDMSEAPAPAATRTPVPTDMSEAPARPAARPRPAAPLDLEAELRLVGEIRGALRRGDAAGALERIAEHKRSFAAGALVQERTAHEVEALCAAGRPARARELAATFLARWPDSTHRARVAAACAE